MRPTLREIRHFKFYTLTELSTALRTTFELRADPQTSFQKARKEDIIEAVKELEKLKVVHWQRDGYPYGIMPYVVDPEDIPIKAYFYYGATLARSKHIKIAEWGSPQDLAQEQTLERRREKHGDTAIWFKWGQEVHLTQIRPEGVSLL